MSICLKVHWCLYVALEIVLVDMLQIVYINLLSLLVR